MAIRDEIRVLKSNTLEEFRQKTNELSIDKVGDNKLLASNITDKTYDFTATAGQKIFEISNGRFEILPEQTIDKTTAPAEAYRVGTVRVKSEGTELTQGLDTNNFIVPNYTLKVTLTGSPTIHAEFIEDAVLTQSGGFSGTLLSADDTTLRFKSFTGTFNVGQNLGIPHTDAAKRIVASNISTKTDISSAYGIAIQLITAASVSDSIQIIATSLVDAINELQDDIGVTENLTTTATNLTSAVNEIESVFDASTYEISAGGNSFSVTSGTFTLDSNADIILDADGADVILKDAGSEYGRLTNASGQLQLKSNGSNVFLTASNTDATFNNNLVVEGTLDVDGNFEVGASKFNVVATSGNTQIDGTLDVDGIVTFDTNTTIGGNLIVNGTTTDLNTNLEVSGTGAFASAVGIDGNFDINTDKFTVAASSGNTVIAGTLNIGSLDTTAQDVLGAINEHESDIG